MQYIYGKFQRESGDGDALSFREPVTCRAVPDPV